jgi:hypothetical protein
MSVAVLERQREIGVLRAIGAPGRTIPSMVQLEGLTMALLGWLLSPPLSVPISAVLARGFASVMFPVPASLLPEPAGAASHAAVGGEGLAVRMTVTPWLPCSPNSLLPSVRAMPVESAHPKRFFDFALAPSTSCAVPRDSLVRQLQRRAMPARKPLSSQIVLVALPPDKHDNEDDDAGDGDEASRLQTIGLREQVDSW